MARPPLRSQTPFFYFVFSLIYFTIHLYFYWLKHSFTLINVTSSLFRESDQSIETSVIIHIFRRQSIIHLFRLPLNDDTFYPQSRCHFLGKKVIFFLLCRSYFSKCTYTLKLAKFYFANLNITVYRSVDLSKTLQERSCKQLPYHIIPTDQTR